MTTIGVIGADTTGGEIAQWVSMCGFHVKLYDSSTKALSNNRQQVINKLQKKVDIEQISMFEAQEIVKRITPVLGISGLSDCELIIDCAPQDLKIKRAIFTELVEIASPDAVLATSSNCLSVTSISHNLKRADQIIGMHFFSPVQETDLVEVITGVQTSPQVIDKATTFARKLMKTAVICKDTPGYVSNRLLMHTFNEIFEITSEGKITPIELDLSTRAFGFEIGLVQRFDILGLDRALFISNLIHQSMFHNPRYMPSQMLKLYVDAGRYGISKQRGLLDYTDPDISSKLHSLTDATDGKECLRLISVLINEACFLVQERIADEETIDKVCKLGLLFPKGVFELGSEIGWSKVLTTILDHYNFTLNPRYRPSVYLKAKAGK